MGICYMGGETEKNPLTKRQTIPFQRIASAPCTTTFAIEREIEKRMSAHPVLSQMMINATGAGGGMHSKGVRSSLANDLQLVRFSGGAVVLLLGPAVQLRPPAAPRSCSAE
jgi:hypothetical protein